MFSSYHFGLVFVLLLLSSCFQRGIVKSNAKPISHEIWNELLQQHVSENGTVNYSGFIQDHAQFNLYLTLLSGHHPNQENWSREERLAYWINAYNAFTVKLIVDNYPVESIKDISKGPSVPFVNSPWDIKFINIEGNRYDLNDIEHGIIRGQFEEPRIHFAVNCASYSCPKLLNEAFTGQGLENQLERVSREFINDPRKNSISTDNAEISKIFSWYRGDFEDVRAFINQYSDIKLTEDATISYKNYDWSLNE